MQIPIDVNEQCNEPGAVTISEDTARLVVLYDIFHLYSIAGNSVRDWHPLR